MVVMLQLLGNSCSCYNNNCITKFLSPDLNFSIYKWFLDIVFTIFYRTVFNVLFIILNSNKYFKIIDSNPQLNIVESFRTLCSLDSSVSYHIQIIGNINSIHIRRDFNFKFGNCVLGGVFIRGGLKNK